MADDIAALRAIAAYIRNRIPHLHGEKLIEAYQELASVNQELAADLSNAAKKAKQARQEQVRALNTRVITEGLGLTKEQRDELRARLSSIDARGRSLHHAGVGAFGYEIGRDDRPIQINLDGRKIAENTTKHQHRRHRRNSSQRRGPNAG